VSELDVHRVICPYRDIELDRLRATRVIAEQTVLALRRMLIATDPTLPNEYDGTAWADLERLHRTKVA